MTPPRDPRRRHALRSRTNRSDEERALVSCRPLGAVFDAVERDGRGVEELLDGVGATREHLQDRRGRVHWDDFRTVIDNATRGWSEEKTVEFGRGLVHSKSQRTFALIARHLFSVSDFYRAICSPRTGYGPVLFPCMDSTFVQLGEDTYQATLSLHADFNPCPAFFVITKGNLMGVPEVLGSPPAVVEMELIEGGARYEIVAPDRSGRLARLRRRLALPFRSGEVAVELQEAHSSLRSRYDALQDALRERERTEEALRESEERNRLLVENVGDAFVVMNEDGRVVDVNERACESLGYTRDELVGMHLSEFEQDWDHDRFVAHSSAVPDSSPMCVEGTHRRRDGSTFPIEARGSWVPSAGGRRLFYGLIRDVSDRVAAREEQERHAAHLRRSQKLEALGTLAGGIMHDFNNLLQAVHGYTELAIASAPQGSELTEDLSHVLEACRRGEQIARQILTFGRVRDPACRPTEMQAVVREGLELMKATLPSTVEIRSELAADCASVMADEGQVQQVLMNLCTNGAHAMEAGGGVLEVTLECVELSASGAERYPDLSPGEHVRLRVRDEGTGIPVEVLDRAFDPFFTTKGGERGTGLGLAVVHGIVQSHGGAIDMESTVGEGTRVTVLLPCCPDTGDGRDRAAPEPQEGAGRILVVDDEPALAGLYERTLHRLGYDVEAFDDSVRALERFREDPSAYDLVITDQTMPTLTGLHLAEQMHAIRPDLSVVLVSGLGTPANHEELTRAGVLEVLGKPFTTGELSEVLARVLGAVQTVSRQ